MHLTKYRMKRIQSGSLLEYEIFPINNGVSRKFSTPAAKTVKRSAAAQKAINQKNRCKKVTRLIYSNFSTFDRFATLTYDNTNLPLTEKEANQKMSTFLRVLKYHAKKVFNLSLKYIFVTEGEGLLDRVLANTNNVDNADNADTVDKQLYSHENADNANTVDKQLYSHENADNVNTVDKQLYSHENADNVNIVDKQLYSHENADNVNIVDKQESVRLHHHIITNFPDRILLEKLWKYGSVKSQALHVQKIEAVAKYLLKSAKKYCCAKNMEQPIIETTEFYFNPLVQIYNDGKGAEDYFAKLEPDYKLIAFMQKKTDYIAGVYSYAKLLKKRIWKNERYKKDYCGSIQNCKRIYCQRKNN